MTTQLILKRILIDGTIMSIIGASLLLFMLYVNPRIALSDYPDDVKTAVPPRTQKELLHGTIFFVLLLIITVGIPLYSTWLVKQQFGEALTYGMAFAILFGEMLLFSLVDLFVLDILICCIWTPQFIVIPGTEGMSGYKDYGRHIKGHATTGNVVLVLFSALFALIPVFLF
ncbi:MAG: nitroreductase [Chloroflexi bacterium]|nr:nitroreductase [Chloroflexota bacterium]